MLTELVAVALLGASAPAPLSLPVQGERVQASVEKLPAPAPRAEDVRPLLPGDPVPSTFVRLPDGKALDIAKFVAEGPAVVIFYRGGW